jgi:hypothetical protein
MVSSMPETQQQVENAWDWPGLRVSFGILMRVLPCLVDFGAAAAAAAAATAE